METQIVEVPEINLEELLNEVGAEEMELDMVEDGIIQAETEEEIPVEERHYTWKAQLASHSEESLEVETKTKIQIDLEKFQTLCDNGIVTVVDIQKEFMRMVRLGYHLHLYRNTRAKEDCLEAFAKSFNLVVGEGFLAGVDKSGIDSQFVGRTDFMKAIVGKEISVNKAKVLLKYEFDLRKLGLMTSQRYESIVNGLDSSLVKCKSAGKLEQRIKSILYNIPDVEPEKTWPSSQIFKQVESMTKKVDSMLAREREMHLNDFIKHKDSIAETKTLIDKLSEFQDMLENKWQDVVEKHSEPAGHSQEVNDQLQEKWSEVIADLS